MSEKRMMKQEAIVTRRLRGLPWPKDFEKALDTTCLICGAKPGEMCKGEVVEIDCRLHFSRVWRY